VSGQETTVRRCGVERRMDSGSAACEPLAEQRVDYPQRNRQQPLSPLRTHAGL